MHHFKEKLRMTTVKKANLKKSDIKTNIDRLSAHEILKNITLEQNLIYLTNKNL